VTNGGAKEGTRGSFRSLRKLFGNAIVRGGLGNLTLQVFGIFVAFLTSVILARLLGAEGMGVYSFAYALVTVLAVPAHLGIPQVCLRETAKCRGRGQWDEMAGVWRWGIRSAALGGSAIVSLVGVILMFIDERLLTDEKRIALLVAFALVPLLAVNKVRGGILAGLHKVVIAQVPDQVIRPVVFIALVVTISLAGKYSEGVALDPITALVCQVLSAAGAFVIGLCLLRAHEPREARMSTVRRCTTTEWWRASGAIGLAAGAGIINQHADILMLGAFRTDGEVGIYRVAVQSGNLVLVGLQAINVTLMPFFSRAYSSKDDAYLQFLAVQGARVSFISGSACALVLIMLGQPFLGTVFGQEFQVGYVALAVLVTGHVFNVVTGSVGVLLNMTGHERQTLVGVSWAATVNLILNGLLIPSFGMVGAAAATAGSGLVWNWILWRAARKHIGVSSLAFGNAAMRTPRG